MKFCLSSRQNREYSLKADEIKIQYRDIKSTLDLIEKYPDKLIILEESLNGEQFNWTDIDTYNKLARGNFMLCLGDVNSAQTAKDLGIKFYMGYPVKTFYELGGLKNLGVAAVRLDAPLFFQMDKVKEFGIPVRVCANLAYTDLLPRENGINGIWIRPEDLHMYEDYVDTIEFGDCDLKKEQALYRIYAEQHEWPGVLNMIITNLDAPGTNRMISSDVSSARLFCGQKCAAGGACKLCFRALSLADPEKVRGYMNSTDQH